ncbi:trypsin-like serine peptidase [Oceaniglobus roseus]|uniref:trypsin-like serine peptidase n=1 Tax=Oceaniglobus roseus TaxID=1737570 RepID=UPI000C7F61E6|nr:trypsin-like serine protease [Kandeliimicrobium roseum]
MRTIGILLGAAALLGSVLAARAEISLDPDASPLKALATSDAGRGWDGVGRLNMGERAFCTGALIADNLVLTAAHCLFDKKTGRPFEASEITFLAGWRDGRAEAYRGVRRAMAHPDYAPRSTEVGTISNDIALIELDQPIRTSRITPFATHDGPAPGAEVGVVSYARDRAETPSLQEVCHVLARQSDALILSCAVDFGASGAPIFVIENGVPQIVSVVSAMAEVESKTVSIGTALTQPLAELKALMAGSDGVFHRAAPTVRRMSAEAARAAGSAKFVRP